MRLKKITLHGYKTFANPTEILFDSNITAIVGPNGSGKSNIADAIRWVMGEQAYSVLRGKKTEDMIFAGSNQRSRMGMAEVSILLDNSDNWLPIDFDEVLITRRAYRSGENEYHINGSRVRLKDVHELLDRSGLGRRTHTVIGQGMVAQILAQRPEDRRILFEEAAGITHYRTKRRLTMDRLTKTRDNLTRVRDIIAEIEPRLKKLEKQAEKAIQHDQISAELQDLLRIWYGYSWHQGVSKLVDARAAVAHWRQVIDKTNALIEEYSQETAALRQKQADLRAKLAQWRRELAALEASRAEMAREQAVARERIRSLKAEQDRLEAEIELLAESIRAEEARWQEARTALNAIHEERNHHQRQLLEAQAALQALEAERLETERALNEARARLMELTTAIHDRESRIAHAQEQRQALKEQLAHSQEAMTEAEARIIDLQAQWDAISARLQDIGRRISDLQEKHRLAEAREREMVVRRARLERQRNEFMAQARELQARYDLLDRLRAEGEGLFAGVKQVVRASHQGQLQGVLGPIATLIQVPDHLEQAIEVALGGRLQDVVVASWDDAQAAIDYLKRTRGGRATFLPLDNLRPQRRQNAPREKGVLGWAADLIAYQREIEPAVELLLGQILVVEDLNVARRISRGRGYRPRIVTLEGDYVHPGGSVSGGSRHQRQKGGVLAREREYRQLPDQIAKAQGRVKRLEEEIESLSQAIAAIEEERTHLVQAASELGAQEKALTSELAQVQSALDQARQLHAWHEAQAQERKLELENFGRRLAQLREEIAALSQERTASDNRIAALEEKLAAMGSAGLMQAVAQAQARLDAIEERVRAQAAIAMELEQRLAKVREDRTRRQARMEAIDQEWRALEERLTALAEAMAQTNHRYEALRGQIEPAQAELDAVENGWIEHDARGEALRARLHQEERQLNQAQLAQQRAEDHLKYLRKQIENDFGLVAFENEAGVASQEPLPFDRIVTTLPRLTEIPPETQAEIRRLKALLRRLGPVNPEAQAEYQATKERFEFLTQQSQDLEEAAGQLDQVIRELDQLMDQEFRRTFKAVAKAFTHYFTRLFGGGTAKLTLTDPKDITNTGVEIIARPPGKRPANLTMLSGGERALTASALIFAIISVSPTPFAVLDEIDAALDEANIGRVRDALTELSEKAQFIIITHSRATLEIADTIYGVSMGQDGISQVLSLKLDGDRLAKAA
ncbi:MAG TPA: chromosome segregation protein SMC [Caldilineae bacterium]|nr:chromosome segregation protein SMC [Caldilineae bacterium]